MSYDVSYGYGMAASAEPLERAVFIRRTYSHLAGISWRLSAWKPSLSHRSP